MFPAIDEEIFSVLYSDKVSRPNTPVNVIVGALILKEVLGGTDDELVQALMFDVRYQYALHTTSFKEQPLSDRTLSRFRARCLAYETETEIDLIHECVTKMAKEISEFMGITPSMQRMDSLMVAANIRNLSMLELFYTCVANLANVMNQRGAELPEGLKHYMEKLCDSNGDFDDTSEYQLLIRLLKERTIMDDGGSRRLRNKEEVEEPSKVLLNPSDPEATFRKKAGAKHLGYVGNITERVGESGSLVTDYAYEQNIYSDNQFINDYLEKQPVYDETVTLVADGAYSGEANVKIAATHQIKFITTNFTSKKPADIFAEFTFSEDGKELLECIHHKHPYYTRYDQSNDRCAAYFNRRDCEECPYVKQCCPRFKGKQASREISWKAVNRAKMLRYMKTEEFHELCHFRNGVEAIPSLLRRKYHVDKIAAHGKRQMRFYFGFKIAALNFQKLFDYANSLDKHTPKTKVA